MKLTTVLFSAALIASAVAQSTTTSPPVPVNTDGSYSPEVKNCLKSCADGDVKCAATCFGNPNPTKEQVNETTKCFAECPQGNGTKEETEAYAKCQSDCTSKYFLPDPSSVPSSGATQTSGTSSPTATDSDGNPINSSTSTSTSTPTGTDGSGASAMVYSASFAGVAAAFAAFLAL